MASLPQKPAPDTFALDHSDTALDALGDRLYMAVGSCEGRLAKAVALVRSGAVTVVGPGYAIVQSQSDPTNSYHVNPQCPCDDAVHRAEHNRCKHRLAAALAHRLVQPTATVPPKAAPLPEAPASANAYITIAGRQAQITIRGHDANALLEELETLLQRFPVEAPALALTTNTGKTPAMAPVGWCSVHNTQMKENTKEGRTWYSHKMADGSWCKGKGK
jgi:hypothetical protein